MFDCAEKPFCAMPGRRPIARMASSPSTGCTASSLPSTRTAPIEREPSSE